MLPRPITCAARLAARLATLATACAITAGATTLPAQRAGGCPFAPRLQVWRTSHPTARPAVLLGTVRDSAGRALAGVRVAFERAAATAAATTTARDGAFRLAVPGAPADTGAPTRLHVDLPGYDDRLLRMAFGPGDSAVAQIELCPASADAADRARDGLDRPPSALLDTNGPAWHVAPPGEAWRPVARRSRDEAVVELARFAAQWRAMAVARTEAIRFPRCDAGGVQVRRIPSRSARPGGLTVRGRVRDVNGTPIPHAALFARDMGTPFGADAEGRFVFSPPLGRGSYRDSLTIEAGAEGHLSRAQRVEYQSGDTLDLDVALCRGTMPLAQQEPGIAPLHHEPATDRRQTRRVGAYDVTLTRDTLVAVAQRSGAPRATLAAFDGARAPNGAFAPHDTLLVVGRRLLVVRYGHGRGPVRIAVVDVDGAGALRRRATYALGRPFPWSAGVEEIARLVDRSTLVVYAEEWWPLDGDERDVQPTLRRIGADGRPGLAVPTTTAWYAVAQPLGGGPQYAVHTLTACRVTTDARTPFRACSAHVVPAGTATNVLLSPTGAELWTDGRPTWARVHVPYRGAAPSIIAAPAIAPR